MHGDEHAEAWPDPSGMQEEPSWELPQHNAGESDHGEYNAFTPISAAQRLKQHTKQSGHASTARPPMRPGQRYGYGLSQPEWAEEPAPEEPSWQAPENLQQYQQEYWAKLQSGVSQPSFPPSMEEDRSMPSYLRDVEQPLPHQALPYPPYEEYGEAQEEAFADLGEYEMGGPMLQQPQPYWEPDPWQPEDWEPAVQTTPPSPPPPSSTPSSPQREPVGLRVKERLGKAFAKNPAPETTPARLMRIISLSLILLMLVFCLLQVGRIVLSLMENDEQMKAVREEYYALAGVELSRDAARVELLPAGVTFTPTSSPEPQLTPEPTPAIPIAQGGAVALHQEQQRQAQEAAQEPTAAESQRTKAALYEDNPMNNILDAFVELRKDRPDLVGRLQVPQMVDQYVMRRNNTYYLTHDFNGSFSASGAVFVDESCDIKTPPENLLLRGQSGVESQMFWPLRFYVSEGAAFVGEHALLQMDTLYEQSQYVIFAVILTHADPFSPEYFNYAGYASFPNDSQMESFVAAAKQHSLYDIPVEVLPSDRLLTLSTLGGEDNSTLVLIGRRLRPGESEASLSKVFRSIQKK